MESIHSQISHFVKEVVSRFDPERIILFGSHAEGNPSPDSDVDLLVVMNYAGRSHERAFEIRREIPRPLPLDLLVRRPSDIERRIKLNDFFMKEIIQKGKTLYERADGGMD